MNNKAGIVDLASAHVTQLSSDKAGKGVWSVQKNITNEELHTLDKNFTEFQIFELLDFARKFELIAFNKGIQFQKEISDTFWKDREKKLLKVIGELEIANDKLASKLGDFIGEDI